MRSSTRRRADEARGVARAPRNSDDAREPEHDGRRVRGQHDRVSCRSAAPAPRALRKHHREMKEHGRQGQNRDDVRPVEHPVEPVEPPAEREGEHAEERDGEPEEMQRRGIARPPQPDRAAHQQRENPDRGQHEVERAGTRRHRSDTNVDHFARAESQCRVAKGSIVPGGVEDRDDIGDFLDGTIVDREQQIAATKPDCRCWRTRCDLGRDNAFGMLPPEHAVFDLMPRRARGDVRGAKTEESRYHDQRQSRP